MKQIERQIEQALGSLRQEIQTFVEVTGVKGVAEHRFVLWSPFGGVSNPKATELFEKGKRMVEQLGAIPETLRFLTGAIEEARKSRTEIDKTHSQEEEAARVADREAEQKAYDTLAAQRIQAADAIRHTAPRWAKAAIIAEFQVDDSDPMTDYFASHTERTLLIGWRSGNRDDFRQMRRSAAEQPETAHLDKGECEHREKYSMGHGYYLAVGRHSGWQVRATSLRSLDNISFENRIKPRVTIDRGDQRAEDQVVMRINEQRDGVELLFPFEPMTETKDLLKAHHFRYSRPQALWYARRTTDSLEFARKLSNGREEPRREANA